MEDIESKLLFTEKRRDKWLNFKSMLDRMVELGLKPDELLIDGSFVTKREEPGDVDFAALIQPETVRKAIKSAPDSEDKEGIHLFINPNNQKALRALFGAHLAPAGK